MTTSLNFTIHAERGQGEYGTAVIVPSRGSWYYDPVTVITQKMVPDLRLLYATAAVEAGRILQRAECVLTNDPGKLDEMLEQHDCDDCRAGVLRARKFLAENQGREIVIALLYWVQA